MLILNFQCVHNNNSNNCAWLYDIYFLQACHDAYGMPCTITSNSALTATKNSIKDTGMMYNAYIYLVFTTRISNNPTIWQVGTEVNGECTLMLLLSLFCAALCKLKLLLSKNFTSWKLFLQNLYTQKNFFFFFLSTLRGNF